MRTWDRTQLALRAVILLTPVVAVLATGTTSPWWVLLALALGAMAWRRPDSLVGLVVLVLVGSLWVAADGDGIPATVLVSVAALVAFEVASILVSYGPPTLRLEPALLRLWAVRALALFLPSFLVLAAGRAFGESAGSAILWAVGLVVAVGSVTLLRGQLDLVDPLDRD